MDERLSLAIQAVLKLTFPPGSFEELAVEELRQAFEEALIHAG